MFGVTLGVGLRRRMSEPVPPGTDAPAGTYRCTYCEFEIDLGSARALPPCPSCASGDWQSIGDAGADERASQVRYD
jgi:hypothetical protein